jgi:hypothetical protein
VPLVQLPLGVFQRVLGFPDFYGRNVNAWLACLTSEDERDGMIAPDLVAGEGDVLVLELVGAKDIQEACPEQYEAFIECAAFVNWRRIRARRGAILALSADF